MQIGERIRTWRTVHEWSQAYLAQQVGLSQRQISRIERDDFSTLRRETLVHIAEALEEPVASGEVNVWLAHCGYAPLVRPGLPLPPPLRSMPCDAAARFVFDPRGALLTTNPVGQHLVGHFLDRWEQFNLLDFTLAGTVALSPGDRNRLWYWTVLGALSAPPEAWAVAVRSQIERAWQRPLKEVWLALQQAVGIPGYWEAPLAVHVGRLTLQFMPTTQAYPLRPDLQLLYLTAAEARTLAWCQRRAGFVQDRRPGRVAGARPMPPDS